MRAEKSVFIYENCFLVTVFALHRVSKAKFSFGAPKSVCLIQCPLTNVLFIEIDSTEYTKSAKVKSENLTRKCKDVFKKYTP